jgi:prepilin-type N-terminal cleavage/methylation domain-containing protein
MIIKKKFLHAMTLLEIMIVLGIIGIILFIAIPGWMRQREQTRGIACQENLTKIDHAKEIYIFDKNLKGGDPVDLSALWQTDGKGYIKFKPRCPGGGQYTANPVNVDPTCSFYGHEVFPGSAQHKLPQ